MAKPNDTRIAHASTHPQRTTQLPPPFIALLQSLLASQASALPTPVPPKSCRPPRIKPRRRVSVRASPAHASDAAIPQISLCGRWLTLAGFGVGTRVRVHVAHEIMILIPAEAN